MAKIVNHVASAVSRPPGAGRGNAWPIAMGCPIETLRAQIMSLHAVLPIRAILMDTVRVGGMSVPFLSHTLKDLQTIGEVVKTVEGGDGARDLHIIALPGYEGLA